MTTAPTHSPKQAAARAGVSPGLVYNWCRDGLLPHYRVGARGRRGKILIADADLAGLLATFRVGGGGPPSPTSGYELTAASRWPPSADSSS